MAIMLALIGALLGGARWAVTGLWVGAAAGYGLGWLLERAAGERIRRAVVQRVPGGEPSLEAGGAGLFLLAAVAVQGLADEGAQWARALALPAAAAVLLVLGWRWRRSRPLGPILQGAGLAVLYIAAALGLAWTGLIPPVLRLEALVLLGVTAVALALVGATQGLAWLGLAMAFLAPLPLWEAGGAPVALLVYFLMLQAIATGLAWYRGWPATAVLALVLALAGIAALAAAAPLAVNAGAASVAVLLGLGILPARRRFPS